MVKVVTQETFNDVVKENMIEFGMSSTDAIKETITQFTSQGVNLSNIIQDFTLNDETGEPILIETVVALKDHCSAAKILTDDELLKNLDILLKELRKDLAYRVYSHKNGATEPIMKIIDMELPKSDIKVLKKAVEVASTIVDKNPDILSVDMFLTIKHILENYTDVPLICDTLKWIQRSCILHEANRQKFMTNKILAVIKPLMLHENPKIIRELCAVFRYLVLDDDIRHAFGSAHEHAREIANETLVDITKLLSKFEDNKDLLSDIILTIAALTVRHEFCTVVDNAGGLKFIMNVMEKHTDLKLYKSIFKLLRALAGNDTIKVNIITAGGAPLIRDGLDKYKYDESFAKHGLGCISTLTLREKKNSLAFFDCGTSEVIIDTMKLHKSNKFIQRPGAWAIRNMVSRSRDQGKLFLLLDAEDILNDALKAHPSIANDIKSALRDLGCKVHLNEEWTGVSAIKITNDP